MRTLLLLFPLALNTFAASPIIFGARGGVPFSDTTTSITSGLGGLTSSQRFEVGPTLGVRLPLGFSVEGDALFKRETLNVGILPGVGTLNTHSDSWEFPAMLRFTAGHQVIAPVLGAGVSVRHINNFGDVPSYLFNGSTSANTVGFVAAGGVRFRIGRVDITPEVRYTRWGYNSLSQSVENLLPLNRNEASVLVGITF